MATSLGRLIRQRRMELGLTQEELAERVGEGVRQAEISRLERDRVTLPRRARLEQIAQALDVPLGVLLARSGWVGAQQEFEPASVEPIRPPADLSGAVPEDEAPPVTEYREPRDTLAVDTPQLSEAIFRARELARHTESVIHDAQVTFDQARHTAMKRRQGRSPAKPEKDAS